MEKLTRAARITTEVLSGGDVLAEGHETARRLWNLIRYCTRLYSGQYRQKFTWLGLGKLPWPGKYGLDKAFRDHHLGKQLADRCYTTAIKEFDIAYRSFMTKRRRGDKGAGLPSLTESASGIGKASQIVPTFVAKFDLRNWAIVMQSSCNCQYPLEEIERHC